MTLLGLLETLHEIPLQVTSHNLRIQNENKPWPKYAHFELFLQHIDNQTVVQQA